MTELEKNVYNSYLRISRTRDNKPFKYRKNFDGFEDNQNYVFVKRLGMFFKSYPHIGINEFLTAPYEVYPDSDPYDLKFYTSLKATKIYGLYKKQQADQLPDCQIQSIKDTLMFIYSFCRDEGIGIEDYVKHMTNTERTFLLHLRERVVNIYVLFGLRDFDSIFSRIDPETTKFIIGHLYTGVDLYRSRYYNSSKAKDIVTNGIKKLKQITKQQ